MRSDVASVVCLVDTYPLSLRTGEEEQRPEEAAKPFSPTDTDLAKLRVILSEARQMASDNPLGARQFVERALDMLSGERPKPVIVENRAACSGGLAAWQELRAKAMIDAQLCGRLPIVEIANAVRLSTSHFARAFKRSIGCPPHRYMLQRRIEHAKQRMHGGAESLAQIALACGFSDQAHFTRCFKRCEGETPTAWFRREASNVTMEERMAASA